VTMPHLTPSDLDALTEQARAQSRRRQHRNLHSCAEEPCQRLINAVEPDSYIPPHCHIHQLTHECLLALRGSFAIIIFDDIGTPVTAWRFGGVAAELEVVEIAPAVWHTVIALEHGSVLFETKSGPYQPNQSKLLAPWAPIESDPASAGYLSSLSAWVDSHLGTRA
jgi:cupin fold WbuC family metalloprotein